MISWKAIFGGIIMKNSKNKKKNLNSSTAQTNQAVSPLIRRWIYRLLVPLGGYGQLTELYASRRAEIIRAIGIDSSNAQEDWNKEETKQAYFARLHSEYEKMESKEVRHNCRTLGKNLKYLNDILGLSEVECKILEFAILLNSESALSDAMGLVRFSSSRNAVKGLALLLGLTESEILSVVDRKQTLRQTGLLSINIHGRFSRSLEGDFDLISPVFTQHMVSFKGNPISLLRHIITQASPAKLALSDYSHVSQNLFILLEYLKQVVSGRKKGVNIFIHGLPGTGKTELAKVLAKELNLDLFEVSAENEREDKASADGRLRAYSAGQALLKRHSALILFDEAEDVFNDGALFSRATAQNHKAWINGLLENNPVPAIWVSNTIRMLDPAFLRRFDMVFELPNPPRQQREKIIRENARMLDAQTVRRLAEMEKLTPAVISRAATVVNTIKGSLDKAEYSQSVEFLVNCTLQAQGHRPTRKNDPNRLPELYDPELIHTDVNLEAISHGIIQSRAARLCLYGPPGTGKTAFGRWLAEQLAAPLLVKRASDLISMWVGETEVNIAQAFREAERENAVLLIDEVDSFLQDRRTAQRNWEVTQVNEMLTQMESFPGVFIASTNLMDNLDQASLRRFDLKVKFGFMKEEQAWALFCRYCHHLGLSRPDGAAKKRLAHLRNLTPGDFAAVARQSHFRKFACAVELLASLEAECALKENTNRTIGFV